MNKYKYFSNFIKGGLTVLISVLTIYGVAQAGTITPPVGVPSAQFYTLSNIWTRLTTNETAGDHLFTFADSLVGSGKTLTEIYNAIPTINPSKLLNDTTYLGITGNISTQTLSSANGTVGAGYYGATTLSAVDTDLIAGNIKSGVTLFGVAGDSNVVNTSSGDAVAGDLLLDKIAWVDGLPATGTMPNKAGTSYTPSNVAQTILAGYYNGSGTVATDANLLTDNIKSGITIFGVSGKTEVVDTTEATVPITAETVLTGKKGFVNGSLITGTMSSGYTYGDSNQAFVLGTATSAGTALKNLWNGTNTPGTFPGGSQALGGVDDYNANNAAGRPTNSYPISTVWTQCVSGNGWCSTDTDNDGNDNEAGADAKDNSTGLVWSLPCNGDGCTSFSDSAPGAYSWDSSATPGSPAGATGNNGKTASELCSSQTGWSLPHQKQLMQAYIDGSWDKNLGTGLEGVSRYYWSATTYSNNTTYAWFTNLSYGLTNHNT